MRCTRIKKNNSRITQNCKDTSHDGCSLWNISHGGEVQPALPHLHLLSLALILIYILPLPLLVSGTILGIMSGVATCETPVVGDIAAAIDCSSGLETGCGWVPAAAAAVVGSPIALAPAEVPCSECQTQS
jgi:hypothetical protein